MADALCAQTQPNRYACILQSGSIHHCNVIAGAPSLEEVLVADACVGLRGAGVSSSESDEAQSRADDVNARLKSLFLAYVERSGMVGIMTCIHVFMTCIHAVHAGLCA